MTIVAKFSSQCRECGRRIRKGERIEWTRGQAAAHTSCVGSSDGAPHDDGAHGLTFDEYNAEQTARYYGAGY